MLHAHRAACQHSAQPWADMLWLDVYFSLVSVC